METENDRILQRACAHMLNQLRNDSDLDKWCSDNCWRFGTDQFAEHELQYTALHKEYEKRVETTLEEFMATERIGTVRDLYSILADAQTHSPTNQRRIDVLLAAGDYMKFVHLMRLRNERQTRDRLIEQAHSLESQFGNAGDKGEDEGKAAGGSAVGGDSGCSGGAGAGAGADDRYSGK